MSQRSVLIILCAISAITGGANAQGVIYVDQNADQEPHNGSSWCQAYLEVYEALAVVGPDTIVRVADGTYLPDTSGLTAPREATFQLINGVTLEGGYAGCWAADPDARDVTLYVTTLSGDLGTVGNPNDNSYHVTTGSGTDATAVLDGFTITAGNADDYGSGGGMYNESGSPSVANCTFSGNSARWSGGGMCNSSSATIDDCMFLENTAAFAGGGMANWGGSPTVTGCMFSGNATGGPPHYDVGFGGGMCNYESSPTVIGCTFSANIAAGFQPGTGAGGGMCNHSSAAVVVNCAFAENQGYEGAGMHNRYDSSPQITDCTFFRNVATSQDTGAGMHNNASSPVVTNCTFVGNTGAGSPCACSNVGGMLNRAGSNPVVTNSVFAGNQGCVIGGMLNEGSVPIVANCTFSGNVGLLFFGAMEGGATVVNSIFWGNGSACEIGGVTATYSDIMGGYAGTGNIDADPLFVRNPDPGPDGEWGTEDDDYGDLRLQPGSPCIDAANNTAVPVDTTDLDEDEDTAEQTPLDLDFHWRFVDDPDTDDTGIADPPDYPNVVDMGAYEFQVSVFGDLDDDFDVDGDDFAIFGNCLSGPDVDCVTHCDAADLDGDADADVHDFMLFQQHFTGPLP